MRKVRRYVSKRIIVGIAIIATLSLVLTACGSTSSSVTPSTKAPKGKVFKIALQLSYSGNQWQSEAADLIKAEAATPPYNKEVKLTEYIAGTSVTANITQMQNEVAAGYNAIIDYPISPTALDSEIEAACKAGVTVLAYDSLVQAPCAYNAHINQYQWGVFSANWLAKELNYHGAIADITGVPGTTVDIFRQKALEAVIAQHPGLSIAGEANGEWAQPQGKTAFASIYAAHPDIKGIYAQAGCWAIEGYLKSLGKALLPCAGEFSNGHHVDMLPTSLGGENLQSSSAGSPAYTGELDLIDAVKILKGQTVPHDIIVPLPHLTTATIDARGKKALGTNPAKGALVFPPSEVPGGIFGDFWSPLVQQGLQAALTGKPDPISTPVPCSQVKGCIGQSGLKIAAGGILN